MTAGVGPLSIVATQDLGQLGSHESLPAVIHWRWYYHFPSLGLWVLLVALLVLVKSNRRGQAWLVLLPVLAVSLGCSMLARLLFLSPENAQALGGCFLALAASWAAVWLLAPWLAPHRIAPALAIALAAMLATGGVYYVSVFGIRSADGLDFRAVFHAAGAFALLAATTLGAFCCRHEYRPGRFVAWLLLWTVVFSVLSISAAMSIWALFWADDLWASAGILLMVLIGSAIGGAVFGVALCLMNLPFLFLAVRNPFYAARFQAVLRLNPVVPGPVTAAWIAGNLPALHGVPATMAKDS